MTDEQIIKAMEYCCGNTKSDEECSEDMCYQASLPEDRNGDTRWCRQWLIKDALELINRKTEEIERFIEIICEGLAQNCGGNCTLPNKMYCQNCHIVADYLLKNGVIVPQCKVGDTVYETDGIRIYELTILDISLHKNKPYYKTDGVDFDDDAIGKSIFLTKEEAEKALKGGAE